MCEYGTYTVVPANMLATPQKLYGQQLYFQILSIFLYDIFVGQPMANTLLQHVFN